MLEIYVVTLSGILVLFLKVKKPIPIGNQLNKSYRLAFLYYMLQPVGFRLILSPPVPVSPEVLTQCNMLCLLSYILLHVVLVNFQEQFCYVGLPGKNTIIFV